MKRLLGENIVIGKNFFCEVCQLTKHRVKFQRSVPVEKAKSPYELIHADLCGPMPVCSIGGASYFICYMDDYSRYADVYPLVGKTSDEICSKYGHFQNMIKNRGFSIKRIRCDNGKGEFSNAQYLGMLADEGTVFEPSPPYCQSKNGAAERFLQTICGRVRAMLKDAQLPWSFWAECVRSALYVHNRSPTRVLGNSTPYEKMFGVAPAIHHLRRFGCLAYRHIPKALQASKFSERSERVMFLGYVHKTTKIFRIWEFSRGKAFECSNLLFREDENGYVPSYDNDCEMDIDIALDMQTSREENDKYIYSSNSESSDRDEDTLANDEYKSSVLLARTQSMTTAFLNHAKNGTSH